MAELHRARRRAPLLLGAAAALGALPAPPACAQGAGSAGAEILQMPAGARATALGGAYTAAFGDPDAVFYNPASVAWLRKAAGLGYQAYVQDVSVGSLSGALRAGPLGLGAGVLFLDAGSLEEIVPDPAYGGERGRGTGERVSATEAAARLAAARTLPGGRAAVGLSLGIVTSNLAGVSRDALFLDAGAQLRVGRRLSLGGSLRNVGTALGSAEMGDAPLPAQARVGAAYDHRIGAAYGARAFADAVWGIQEQSAGLALGAEAGLLPPGGAVSAVLRAGVALGEGEGNLGRLRFGGGVSIGSVAVDYAVQAFEYLGTIHRVGIRWSRLE
ncbi:MAG TPA: hypothetical protein VMM12_07915 [Longimicrobiales bacterium]|nr:hypothetical protein [Longimicrobiales bacterium]